MASSHWRLVAALAACGVTLGCGGGNGEMAALQARVAQLTLRVEQLESAAHARPGAAPAKQPEPERPAEPSAPDLVARSITINGPDGTSLYLGPAQRHPSGESRLVPTPRGAPVPLLAIVVDDGHDLTEIRAGRVAMSGSKGVVRAEVGVTKQARLTEEAILPADAYLSLGRTIGLPSGVDVVEGFRVTADKDSVRIAARATERCDVTLRAATVTALAGAPNGPRARIHCDSRTASLSACDPDTDESRLPASASLWAFDAQDSPQISLRRSHVMGATGDPDAATLALDPTGGAYLAIRDGAGKAEVNVGISNLVDTRTGAETRTAPGLVIFGPDGKVLERFPR